jgi:hypothetical protein
MKPKNGTSKTARASMRAAQNTRTNDLLFPLERVLVIEHYTKPNGATGQRKYVRTRPNGGY